MEILDSIITILVGGITGVADGIGTGLSELASSIFLVPAAEGGAPTLSVMGTLIAVFAAISLALGLSRWVLSFVTSLGARNS